MVTLQSKIKMLEAIINNPNTGNGDRRLARLEIEKAKRKCYGWYTSRSME